MANCLAQRTTRLRPLPRSSYSFDNKTMTTFYRWLVGLFAKTKKKTKKQKTNFEIYCELNPGARECRIYEN
jgi:hypothetical protein